MTIRDLMNELAKYPLNQEVWISVDPEGNSFHPLDGPDELWVSEDGQHVMDETDYEHWLDEGGVEYQKAVILWP